MIVIHARQSRCEQPVSFSANFDRFGRVLHWRPCFRHWQLANVFLHCATDSFRVNFSEKITQIVEGCPRYPAAYSPFEDHFSYDGKQIHVRIVWQRDIKVRLYLCSGRCCYRKSFPVSSPIMNPQVTACQTSASAAVDPLSDIVVRIWNCHSFFKVEKLSKAVLPKKPTCSHVRFNTFRSVCSNFVVTPLNNVSVLLKDVSHRSLCGYPASRDSNRPGSRWMHPSFAASACDLRMRAVAQHFVFNTETAVHHIDVKIAPTAIGDVFRPAVNLRPISFFQFAAHHPRNLCCKKSVSTIALSRCKC